MRSLGNLWGSEVGERVEEVVAFSPQTSERKDRLMRGWKHKDGSCWSVKGFKGPEIGPSLPGFGGRGEGGGVVTTALRALGLGDG